MNLGVERLISVVHGPSCVYYVYVCVCSDTLFHLINTGSCMICFFV